MMKISAVILAAGQGTRMRSNTPKVLHLLAGQPLIRYSLQAAAGIGTEMPVVVIGHGSEQVRQVVGDEARFVLQEPQLGTGHAVRTAESLLAGKTDLVLVISADMPLMSGDTLRRIVSIQQANPGPVTILTVISDDSRGFGRVIRALDGSVREILEEAQATPEQLAIRELNVGAYCFKANWLWDALKRVPLSPKGEYYLTDTVGLAVANGLAVQALALEDASEAMGINTRVHLAEAESVLHQRINTKHMLAGVTLVDPNSTYIQAGVTIGKDTIVWPNTYLRGKTTIGEGCTIGPNTIVEDTQIGNACTVLASVLEGAVVDDHVGMGPFCHLRKGAHLAEDVHMGNFGEVKDSYLGPGTKMGHFSYIGNAHIGADVNIGAGTITCNFDGVNKNPTEIGAHAFIGSDTMLVAPVSIGEGARTGAGSVVTHDVPPLDVVVGVPARHLEKSKIIGKK
jgi:bifunctional UDP-N-acetylglucosamine pyrophosphorylase/glucosamine-1-phosphate N-acetyltransferase